MKKFLLTLGALALVSGSAFAADYEFQVSNEKTGYTPINFFTPTEGQEIVVKYHTEDSGYGDYDWDADLYLKATNNTGTEADITIEPTMVYDKNEGGAMFQTCFNQTCQSGTIKSLVKANATVGGSVADHLGYSGIADKPEDYKFDAKYNVKVTFGTLTTNFTVHFTSEDSSVGSLNVAGGVAEYYNLQGVKVAPEKGQLCIKVQDGKAKKVVF